MLNKEEVLSFISKTWYVFLIVALIIGANYLIVKDLKKLPSPLYGGDYWNHLGIMYHLYYGGSFFASAELVGETPWVPELYHIYNLFLSFITGWDPMAANLFNSLFLIPLTAFAIWYLVKRFTDNKILITAAIVFVLSAFPFFKYTEFAYFVMTPLLLCTWYWYLDKKEDIIRLMALAVMMGLCSLTNTQLFFATYILFGVFVLDRVCYFLNSSKKLGLNPETISEFSPYIMVFVVSSLIALIYWFWPIFVYLLHTPNDMQIYGWVDFTDSTAQLSYSLNVLSAFINPGNPFNGLISLLMLGGIWVVVTKREDHEYHFAFLVLIVALIGLFHHLVTFNLFHIHLGPERLFQMFTSTFGAVFLVIATVAIMKSFKRVGRWLPYIVLLAALCIFNINFSYWQHPPENGYVMYAKEPLTSEFINLQKWIDENTDVNDVFLTDNEDAFMMNGLTGRKSVSYRRTHTSQYADIDQRNLDSAVMLYGSNNHQRDVLLKKYNVKYVLWTSQWFSNQILIENDSITRMFDPFMAKDSPERQAYLTNNDVYFITMYYYLDPAFLPDFPKYNVIITPPQGISYLKPWNPGLDAKLTEVYVVEFENAPPDYPPFAVIYEVSYD